MKSMLKYLLSAIVILGVFSSLNAAPKREFRSTWLATVYNLDWPRTAGTSASQIQTQKTELDTYINTLADQGFVSICFQVRSMCDAMYKSSLAPWSSYLTGNRGTDPGWDPLQYAIDKCHSRGLECYAWLNPFRFSSGTAWSTSYDNTMRNNGWLLSGTANTNYTVVNPGIPEVQDYVVNVCKEIVENYNVDGILFDDYFYPSGGLATNSSAGDYALWQSANSSMSIGDWRRNNVRIVMQRIYNMIQERRPDLRFGVSPAGVAGTSATSASKYGVTGCPKGVDWQYDQIYSDPLSWLYDGSIDFISPQIYWGTTHSTNPFGPLTDWWSYCANHFNRHHYASQSITSYSSSNTESDWKETEAQIKYSRQYTENNASGCVFYSAAYISGHKKSGFGNYLKNNTFNTKALSPVVTWKAKKDYSAPTSLKRTNSNLTWDATTDPGRIIKYTVYAIPNGIDQDKALGSDGDGIDATYLQGVSYTNSYTLTVSSPENYWYAVCVYDGFGNESAPAYSGLAVEPTDTPTLISPINNSVTSLTQLFSWSAVTDATFTLEISKSAEFISIALSKSDIATNSISVDLSSLEESTTYYWRVKAKAPLMIESTSAVASFLTMTRPRATATTLVSPANDAELEDEVTFVWNRVDADSYVLEFSSSTSFDTLQKSYAVAQTDGTTISKSVQTKELGKGTFFWRVKTLKNGCADANSVFRSFRTSNQVVGEYEEGYVIKNDANTYENVENVACANLWMRSTLSSFNNFGQTDNGLLNRGMCAKDNYVYISGRTSTNATADVYLSKYDGYTGEHITDIYLTAGSAPYAPCNNLFKDSKGNICFNNMSLNISTTPLVIHTANPETGEAKLVASCSYTTTGRIDYATVVGDVTSGNFWVLAPLANTTTVLRWKFVNSQLTETKSCTLQSLYPSSATTLGIAPVIIPVTENDFFISGGNTPIARYDFSTGKMTDCFSNNPAMEPSSTYQANGGKMLLLDDKNYFIYPLSDHTAANGIRINMVGTNSTYDFSSMTDCWTLPKTGLGNFNSQTWKADIDFVEFVEGEGHLYLYSPGNGLSAYRITNLTSTSNAIEAHDKQVTISVYQGRIHFSQMVDEARIYNSTGILMKVAKNITEMPLTLEKGIYIVKAFKNGTHYDKKIINQ